MLSTSTAPDQLQRSEIAIGLTSTSPGPRSITSTEPFMLRRIDARPPRQRRTWKVSRVTPVSWWWASNRKPCTPICFAVAEVPSSHAE
ncbi:hypothetical protein BHS07_26990 [Myxococcus xanthus]|nr:hypothetical protein BHS07_26990 [Myxococcus xanthus]